MEPRTEKCRSPVFAKNNLLSMQHKVKDKEIAFLPEGKKVLILCVAITLLNLFFALPIISYYMRFFKGYFLFCFVGF